MRTRDRARAAWTWIRERDLAVAYALIVLVVALVIHTQPRAEVRERLVLESSTNLANLRDDPIFVLIVSAFVVSSISGLWILAPLVVAFGAVQRWLGRIPTVVVAVIGHVGGTLFVAVLLATGLAHGRLGRSILHVPDVGVSYALAAVVGLLAAVVPRRWLVPYVVGLLLYFSGPLAMRPTYTDAGHTTALALGFGLAVLAHRAATRPAPLARVDR
jgi:rhomboid family protein